MWRSAAPSTSRPETSRHLAPALREFWRMRAGTHGKLYHGSVPLYYCSYDQRGNLFVSGVNSQYGNQAALYRFPKGGRVLKQSA